MHRPILPAAKCLKLLDQLGSETVRAGSAGLEPGKLNQHVVKVMQEIGIDMSKNVTQSVFALFKQGKRHNAVITAGDAASAETCPVFSGIVKRFGWAFADPWLFTGTRGKFWSGPEKYERK